MKVTFWNAKKGIYETFDGATVILSNFGRNAFKILSDDGVICLSSAHYQIVRIEHA